MSSTTGESAVDDTGREVAQPTDLCNIHNDTTHVKQMQMLVRCLGQ